MLNKNLSTNLTTKSFSNKSKRVFYLLFIFLMIVFHFKLSAQVTNTLNLTAAEMTPEGINNALIEGSNWLNNLSEANKNNKYIVQLPKGNFKLGIENSSQSAVIRMINLNTERKGNLVLKGGGTGINGTKLEFVNNKETMLQIEGSHFIKLQAITFTRSFLTVSQGEFHNYFKQGSNHYLELDVDPGFPTPDNNDFYEIAAGSVATGRYIRIYNRASTTSEPSIVTDRAEQFAWEKDTYLGNGRYRIKLISNKSFLNNNPNYFKSGDLIGLKSKNTGLAYKVLDTKSIKFINLRWERSTRGVFRKDVRHILVKFCKITRPVVNGITACLSGPGGGPQIGQPGDEVYSRNARIVLNCFTGLGDDAIGLFKVNGVKIKNNTIKDCFHGGTFSPDDINGGNLPQNVCMIENDLVRCKFRLGSSLSEPQLNDDYIICSEESPNPTGKPVCPVVSKLSINDSENDFLIKKYSELDLKIEGNIDQLKVSGKYDSLNYSIFDFDGNFLFKGVLNDIEQSIDISNLSRNNIYIFKFNSDKYRSIKKIFIK